MSIPGRTEFLIPDLGADKTRRSYTHRTGTTRAPAGDTLAIFSLEKPETPELVEEVYTDLRHLRRAVIVGEDSCWVVLGGTWGGCADSLRGLRSIVCALECTNTRCICIQVAHTEKTKHLFNYVPNVQLHTPLLL